MSPGKCSRTRSTSDGQLPSAPESVPCLTASTPVSITAAATVAIKTVHLQIFVMLTGHVVQTQKAISALFTNVQMRPFGFSI